MADDLRTLAAEALRAACPDDAECEANEAAGRNCRPIHDTVRRLGIIDGVEGAPEDLADAVLAAVLPAHRAEVLAEAAQAIEDGDAIVARARQTGLVPNATNDPVGLLRRLAATSPTDRLASTLPAQQGEVVPVEAPEAHSGSQGPWTCTCHPGVTWTWTPWPPGTNAWAILGHTGNAILAQADGTVYAYYAGLGALRKEHAGVVPEGTPEARRGAEGDKPIREMVAEPNVWVSFHGLDFAVAWHRVPNTDAVVLKVLPHADDWTWDCGHDLAAFGRQEERLRLAKLALVETGYFTEAQVSDDVAPRIVELEAHRRRELAQARADVERLGRERDEAVEAMHILSDGIDQVGRQRNEIWAERDRLAETVRQIRELRDSYWRIADGPSEGEHFLHFADALHVALGDAGQDEARAVIVPDGRGGKKIVEEHMGPLAPSEPGPPLKRSARTPTRGRFGQGSDGAGETKEGT